MRYSIESRDRRYVKGYRFLSFAKNTGNLKDFTNLFSPNDFKKNDDIILIHFKNR